MGSHFRCYRYLFTWCFLITSCCFSVFSFATDGITRGQSVRDGDIIISSGQKFALGFFSPQESGCRYVGIWNYRVANGSVVWVANRERPISGTDGILTIGEDGNLIVMNGNGDKVWSSNVTVGSSNSRAVLMDTGNLVLHSIENLNTALWRSFDHPTDTYLPYMKIQLNLNAGDKRVLTSWRSPVDPSPGNYSMGLDIRGSLQVVIWEGQKRHWRSGYWTGLLFTDPKAFYFYGFRALTDDAGRLYLIYLPPPDDFYIRKLWMDWKGTGRQEKWIDKRKGWSVLNLRPASECDMYNRCGPFGKCNEMEKPRCSCIEGFVPYNKDQWSKGNWSDGCIRREELQCQKKNHNKSPQGGEMDGFLEVPNVKLPDVVNYTGSHKLKVCEKMCLQNCSCVAYAFVSGINCMIWTQDLVDVQKFEEGWNSLFIRLAPSELAAKNRVAEIAIIMSVIVGMLFVFVSICLLQKHKKRRQEISSRNPMPKVDSIGEISADFSVGLQASGTEFAVFNFSYVVAATDNFSSKNKLGHGGFGAVYKGKLPGGQEIAVKRLSKRSDQGLGEFMNEVMLIANLQHRNLVRLLGCCIQGEERMLLYEYMPNGSLDSHVFDAVKRAQLDWSRRFTIIEGIVRGLLYLHRDSRLRVIHRDLKASNILLDEEMNPKISDFGMAKIYNGNQNQEDTNRVVGTRGYMAPEYAIEGLLSLKLDVYSFGVLLLEIITGKKNTSFRSEEHSNIIEYAWDLWVKGREMELVDPLIIESCSEEQVARCMHVGMLCVQDNAAHRPNMPTVALMLESKDMTLPMPKQPTFTWMRHNIEDDMWNRNQDVACSNNMTISVIVGR